MRIPERDDLRRVTQRMKDLGPRLQPLPAAPDGGPESYAEPSEGNWFIVHAFKQALSGILSLINDLSQLTVSRERIFRRYQSLGHPVSSCEDIQSLDVATVDALVRAIGSRYAAAAAVEGGVTGGLSVLGPAALAACIATDSTALIALNLRAVGEYATYYGFDIGDPRERLYALNVLLLASSVSATSKTLVLAELAAIAHQVSVKKTWEVIEKQVMAAAARRIATMLGFTLTKAQLKRLVPVAGVVVGSGFNAAYTRRVCHEAPKLYRERFLASQDGLGPEH